MTIFALIDCNNFYASCERAFNPRLDKQPIVVLSNNDGCIIARSNEAKKLGIPMGAPFFKWKAFCISNNVHVFSSNYELYGDMSYRVMNILATCCPSMEIYSIDEAFLLLDEFAFENLENDMLEVRNKIKRYTGLPVSIGFAQSKTLAKIANHIAKIEMTNQVFDLCDLNLQEEILARFPIERIWGIGNRLSQRLQKLNIYTAKQLRDTNPKIIRAQFNVTVEKTVRELQGVSCLPMESVKPRKEIISSRSFGKAVFDLSSLEEAVSHYASIATLKLRNQKSVAGGIYVFLQTNLFSEKEAGFSNGLYFHFSIPTADTRLIIKAAKYCLQRIYKKGYKYHKAGLMLLNLTPNTIRQYDLFTKSHLKSEQVMKVIDNINETIGKNTIFYCAEGIKRTWQIKSDRRSPRYTTRWKELVMAKA